MPAPAPLNTARVTANATASATANATASATANATDSAPAARPGPHPAPGLLRSKLIPPGATAAQVPRAAVCRAIVAASAAKLVLVRAPAGFGKTSAMVQARQHLAAGGVATAWLTLDRADNDMPRFLAGLQQAVLRLGADPADLPADHPAADPAAHQAADPTAHPADHRAAHPADRPADRPTDQPADQPPVHPAGSRLAAQPAGHNSTASTASTASAPESSPDPAAALGVLDTLAAHNAPFVLFLDDFELITETAVLGLVREILGHLPRRGQLVLGSRSLPDLGLGRLRAAGQLLEIDTEQLRFSLAETQQFFALRHPGPGQTGPAAAPGQAGADLQTHLPDLLRKTEGWIAALWLASMALDAVIARQGSVADFIHQFSGSDRAVADFLAEDVLARQPPEIRDFLLRTSLLRQLSAPLCQALSPRSDARRILARLDAANLFITPVGHPAPGAPAGLPAPEREWRYHSLFADFLRAQLARERPDELARLHLAAAAWYEAEGRPVPAIDHAIEGGDGPLATSLLARHAMVFLAQGRMRLLARWFAALPAAPLHEQPMLQVVSLWASSLTRGPWDAMAQLQQSGIANSTDPAVLAHVHALQPMLLAMMDRVDEASAIGLEHLASVPTGQPFADSVLCNAMAHVMGVLGDRAQAQRLLDAARRGQPGNGFNRMYSESVEGLQDLQQGRLRQATARFRLAVGVASGVASGVGSVPGMGAAPGQPATGSGQAAGGFPPSHGNAWAGVLYAGAVYESHQLALAEHLLNIYLPLARDVGLPDHMILSHTMRSRIAFQRGDIDAALHAITELEYLGHHRQLPRVVASARLERARVLVLQGQADAARLALDRADDASVWQRVAQQHLTAHDVEDMVIGRLRWQVAFGDAVAAARQAGLLAQQARQAVRLRRALRLQVLQALAWLRCGSLAAAADGLAAVLQAAAAEGFVHLLLDEGPAVGALLRCLRDAPGAGLAADPITADHLQHLLRIVGPDEPASLADHTAAAHLPGSGSRDTGSGSLAASPVEPLTRKELRVLQLLAEGYSNSAMAEKLFVSDSTVRTHLRNINMKLDARSRTQAVAIARRLGLMR